MAVFTNVAGFADIKPDPADRVHVRVSDGTALCWDGSTVPKGMGCGEINYNPADKYEPPAGFSLVLKDEFEGEMFVPTPPDPVQSTELLDKLAAELGTSKEVLSARLADVVAERVAPAAEKAAAVDVSG